MMQLLMRLEPEKNNPWSDGGILAKFVWKDEIHLKWKKVAITCGFFHTEFMIKDSEKYKWTGGLGFARWKGIKQESYGEDASFVQECFGCHQPVKDNDYVFTHPSQIP